MAILSSKLAPLSITSSKVLLVEGKDEFYFFEELLKHLQYDKHFDMMPVEVGGKDRIRSEFPAFLNAPGFDKVTAYAIIRDADKSFKSALESVQSLLKKHKQPYPKNHAECASNGSLKVGIFIMPGKSSKGAIEDLCLHTVQDNAVMSYVENFMLALKNDSTVQYPKNESKAKVQAFLSAMSETVPNVGLAAKKGYWPFNHNLFSELRDFLKELAE